MIHLYIGNGKGKTSAALGVCIRAAGFGRKVYIAQFLKSSRIPCGEMSAIKKWLKPNVTIERYKDQEHPFFFGSRQFDRKKFLESLDISVSKLYEIVHSKRFQVVMMDEILDAVDQGFVAEERLLRLMKDAAGIELILTGRTASEKIKRLASYVSLITKIKHPFDRNVKARKGIEY